MGIAKRKRRVIIIIASAVSILILSCFVSYGEPYLKQFWSAKNRDCEESKGRTTADENATMQEIQYFEQSSKKSLTQDMGRWLYRESNMGDHLQKTSRSYLDEITEKWIEQKATDEELTEWMSKYLKEQGIDFETVGVMSNQRCLFEKESKIPDYKTRLMESDGIYEFIGLYTEGQRDENGKLICYYWEAGAR